MLGERTSVTLITQEHRYMGKIATAGQRVLEVFNDMLTDYVQLHDAHVYRVSDMNKRVAVLEKVTIRKAELNLVLIQTDQHEAPRKRQYSYVQKKLYKVFLIVPGYEVEGKIHLNYTPDPVAVLTRDTSGFFPVTSATIAHSGSSGADLEVPVVMVHKASVSLFYVGEEP